MPKCIYKLLYPLINGHKLDLSIATIESGDKVTVTGVESTTIVNVYKQTLYQ
jgi:hypothetical protein